MLGFISALTLGLSLVTGTTALAVPSKDVDNTLNLHGNGDWNQLPGCGALNILYTGLPANHPIVVAQGFDPAIIEASLRNQTAAVIKAGYNFRFVQMRPEVSLSVLANHMDVINWAGTGIGYGVRGSRLQNLTIRFGDTIDLFHHRAPNGPTVFDYDASSILWSIQQKYPLSSNCTNSPGKDLGYDVICDICKTVAEKITKGQFNLRPV